MPDGAFANSRAIVISAAAAILFPHKEDDLVA